MNKRCFIILIVISFLTTPKLSFGQAFDCYISNDHLTSDTVYEFDVYIKATDIDFRFRTFQLALKFNSGFTNIGGTYSIIYVSGSTQLVNYMPGNISYTSVPQFSFQVASSSGVTCTNGTAINVADPAKRIGTFRITSSLPFNCVSSNPSMIRPFSVSGVPVDTTVVPLTLKTQVTKWAFNNCASSISIVISNFGTYSSFYSNALINQTGHLDSINNMRPFITQHPVNDTALLGENASFSIAAIGNGTDQIVNPLTYQWYNGITQTPLSNGGAYSGVSTPVLTIINPSITLNNQTYFCKISQGPAGQPNAVYRNSNSAILKINLSQNLVADYQFNGNAQDLSGQGNNGTVNGPSLTFDRFGNPNKAYHFDGIDDYISFQHSPIINDTVFTITAWIKKGETTSYCPIISLGCIGSYTLNTTAFSIMNIYQGSCLAMETEGAHAITSIDAIPSPNEWIQVAVVHTTSGYNINTFKFYINGIPYSINTQTSLFSPFPLNNIMNIGREFGTFTSYFLKGDIDEIKIYNSALSDAQITSLYTPAPKTEIGLNSGLISYWKLDGNSNDAVGLNHGIYTSTSFSSSSGKINQGAGFNGINSGIQSNIPFNLPINASISCWFKTTELPIQKTPLLIGFKSSSSARFILNLNSSTATVSLYGLDNNNTNNQILSTGTYNDDNWHFAVGVKSGNTIKLYIDNILIGTNTVNYTGNFNNGIIMMGHDIFNSEYYNGALDECSFWGRTLSTGEISELYNNGNGLQYPFVHTPTLNYATNPLHPSGRVAEPINVATGSYEYSHEDLKVNTLNGTHTFSRYYDSKHLELTSLGYGWSHNYNFFIINYNDSLYQVHYGDGHTAEFLTTNINGELKSIYGGTYEILSKDTISGAYNLKFKNQDVYFFDSSGRLINITDRNGNTTLLNYSGNNLTQIVFPGGRFWTLSYNGSLISSITNPLGHSIGYAHDVSNNLTTVTDAKGGSTEFDYDLNHRIIQITLPKGNLLISNIYDSLNIIQQTDAYNAVTSIQYNTPVQNAATVTLPGNTTKVFYHDISYRLIQETNELGKNSFYHYDSNNNRDTVTDEKGIITIAEYDNRGNLSKLKKPQGLNGIFVYDNKNDLFSSTDPLLRTTSYDRDVNGNIISVSLPDNSNTTMTVNNTGQVIESRDGLNNLTTYTYNSYGDLTTEVRPNGTYTYTYDAAGRLITSTDPLNNTTTFAYDNNDNQTSITDPLDQEITFLYDANDNLIRKTDKKQLQTNHSYDLKDRLISSTDPDSHSKTFSFDVRDNIISETDENGHATTYGYDSKNRKISTTNSLNATVAFTYDDNDNLLSSIDPNGVSITNEYDSLNRKISTSNALNQTTSYSYDAVGNLIQETDPLGRSTAYAYDSLNRLKQVTDAAGGIVIYTYDANGNMTTIRDPNGHIQTIVYDNSNRPITTTDADNKTTTNTYDAVGNITSVSMPNGTLKTTGYDALYRPTSIGFSTGQNYVFTYDSSNNVLTAICPTGIESFQYDNLNRKTQFTDVFGNIVSYTYDYAGNRTSVSYPGNNQVAYQYNALNQITSVTDWLSNQTNYNYDATGRLLNLVYPNGIKCDYSYDLRNRLIQLSHYKTASSDTIYHSVMTLDGNGNRTEQIISGLPLLSLSPSSNNYTYTNADKLTGDGTTQYTNDDNGNRISQIVSGNTTAFGFTAENFLNSITTASSTTLFDYDTFGNRIKKTINGNQTKFVLDLSGSLSQVLQEQNSAGNVQANYIFGLGLIASIDSAGNIIYYHFDVDGNTTALSDDSAHITDTYLYEPFGNIINHSGPTVQYYCFLGKYGVQMESNDLYFIRARYYDADVGRFISKDVYPITTKNSQTINRFVYGINNPNLIKDINGLFGSRDNSNSTLSWISNKLETANYFLKFPKIGMNILKLSNHYIGSYDGNLNLYSKDFQGNQFYTNAQVKSQININTNISIGLTAVGVVSSNLKFLNEVNNNNVSGSTWANALITTGLALATVGALAGGVAISPVIATAATVAGLTYGIAYLINGKEMNSTLDNWFKF